MGKGCHPKHHLVQKSLKNLNVSERFRRLEERLKCLFRIFLRVGNKLAFYFQLFCTR